MSDFVYRWIGLDWLSYNDTIEYDGLKKGNWRISNASKVWNGR